MARCTAALWLITALTIVVSVRGQKNSDQTLESGAKGAGVVEATCSVIEASCVFSEDKLFMRRLAYVESTDGFNPDTFRSGYYGGIWQVDQAMFEITQESSVRYFLLEPIQDIQRAFGIDWPSVQWEDLTKPLYSYIGARLYLQYQSRSIASRIPRDINAQGDFWVAYYRPDKTASEYVSTATRLEQGCTSNNGADIIFLVDGSGSITTKNFDLVKKFVKDVSAGFEVGTGEHQNRIGVIQFATSVKREFDLKTYTTNAKVSSAIDKIRYQEGWTYTNLGLDEMVKNGFSSANGARDPKKGHPRVAIVITDGASTDPKKTVVSAMRTHDADITVFAIGVGKDLNIDELEIIASSPTCLYVALLQGFTEFESLKYIIEQKTCDAPIFITPGQNSSTGGRLPPDESQNCKIKVPADGATVELETSGGTTSFYIARSTYPNNEYYEEKIYSSPGNPGILYIPQPPTLDAEVIIYCNIKGDNHTETNITIGCGTGDHRCKHNPCKNGGTCIKDRGNTQSCKCPPGFTGKYCENVVDRCNPNPCHQGSCVSLPGGDYKCNCHHGFTGDRCQSEIDVCASDPCVHGDCHASVDIVQEDEEPSHEINQMARRVLNEWLSKRGYDSGKNRAVRDIDEISQQTGHDQYVCRCKPGYTGRNCESAIDRCDPNPCHNGQCVNLPGGDYKCNCHHGYTGDFCQSEIDICASAPCIHGDCYTVRPEQGPIVDDTELEFGQLPNEIETPEEPSVGNLPSHDINQLARRLKVDTSSLQELLARRGFISSKRREVRSTDDVAQQPGHDQYKCRCKPGYTGKNCESAIDRCDPNPCHNGQCVNLPDGHYKCNCHHGYTGVHCQSEIDACASAPCIHGDCYTARPEQGPIVDDTELDFGQLPNEIETPEEPSIGNLPSDDINQLARRLGVDSNSLQELLARRGFISSKRRGIRSTDDIAQQPGHGNYECRCKPGYTGRNCESEIDGCKNNPCIHGECFTSGPSQGAIVDDTELEVGQLPNDVESPEQPSFGHLPTHEINQLARTLGIDSRKLQDLLAKRGNHLSGRRAVRSTDHVAQQPDHGNYECRCKPGYTGKHCDSDINECASDPCVEGTCHDKVNGFECKCQPGFTGTNCEIPINECSSNPCGDNAECKPIHNGYECCCNPGWTGKHCESRLDECHSNPCVHGECKDGDNMYRCICKPGYTGINCEIDIDECESNPCINGDCTDKVNGYRCTCLPGWTGKICGINIDECASNPCVNGDCVDDDNRYTCNCLPGWTGSNCETDIDDCKPNPCIHGKCEDKVNDYLCHCPPGWTGKNCDEIVDECASSPCVHGDCEDEINGFVCNCLPGYTDELCQTEINECESDPCHNNAECKDKIDGYSCDCKEGYTGLLCETDIDECESTPCVNGECTDNVNGYTCQCENGWTGEQCQTDIEECASDPCEHGDCLEGQDQYTCTCYPGWTGVNCETDIDDCKPDPCVNGRCSDLVNDYKCDCLPGYTGRDCETNIDECESNPCIHGECTDRLNYFLCRCKPGYTGLRCESEIDECSTEPCANNAECRDEINDYECICPPGWTGKDCVDPILECLSNPCQHGICEDRINGYVCECEKGWTGTHCDCVVDYCENNPCENGVCDNILGGYKCYCRLGFTGETCENRITTTTRTTTTTTTERPDYERYNCNTNNPCNSDNTQGGQFYFPHEDDSKFVQCSEWGQCYVVNCAPGLVWDVVAYTCNRP